MRQIGFVIAVKRSVALALAGGLLAGLVLGACSSSDGESSSTTALTPTTVSRPTTTPAAPDTTTSTVARPSIPVDIVEPALNTTVVAGIDLGDGTLGAPVRLAASLEIPAGETVEVSWRSDLDGELGTGAVVEAVLSNDRRDVVVHRITVTVVSSGGGLGSAVIDVIVRVPSN